MKILRAFYDSKMLIAKKKINIISLKNQLCIIHYAQNTKYTFCEQQAVSFIQFTVDIVNLLGINLWKIRISVIIHHNVYIGNPVNIII